MNLPEGFGETRRGNTTHMDHDAPLESVDDTLQASAIRVKTSRQLLAQIDERLERSAQLLQGEQPDIDLRDRPDEAE